jgi:16S rRNA (uracil1498-N3)-methyltransferase
MARRLLVPELHVGRVALPGDQAHHARDVLRLGVGDAVELFTATGRTGAGLIVEATPASVVAEVREIREAADGLALMIASAVPKGARGDWMIEKLSELGVARFVPLMTARSVVHPEGRNKIERWQRLAAESAKQSHRSGVMRIEPLTALDEVLKGLSGPAAYLSTAAAATVPLSTWFVGGTTGKPEGMPVPPGAEDSQSLTLLVGPEGGWSEEEMGRFAERHLTPLTLGRTILRVETSAIAAAAVVAALTAPSATTEASERSSKHP